MKKNIVVTIAGCVVLALAAFGIWTGMCLVPAHTNACRSACQGNLYLIDSMKNTYAVECGATNGTQLTWDNLCVYDRDLTNHVFCSSAPPSVRSLTNYTINPIGVDAVCNVMGAKSLRTTTLDEVDVRGMTFNTAVPYLFTKVNQRLHVRNSRHSLGVIAGCQQESKETTVLDAHMKECAIYAWFATLARSAGLNMAYRNGTFIIATPWDLRTRPSGSHCGCMRSWTKSGWSVDEPMGDIDLWDRRIPTIVFNNTPLSEAIVQLQSVVNSNGGRKVELSFNNSEGLCPTCPHDKDGANEKITFSSWNISVYEALKFQSTIVGYHVAYRGQQAVFVRHRSMYWAD